MAGTDTTLLPQEVCKSNLRPGFAESAGGMSEAGSRGRATGRRAAPQAKSWGLSWWAGAQRGAEGSLLPPGCFAHLPKGPLFLPPYQPRLL